MTLDMDRTALEPRIGCRAKGAANVLAEPESPRLARFQGLESPKP
jgi:hypothetical protein